MSVVSVAISQTHVFSKSPVETINLIKGVGVEGDCHAGATVQHLSRRKAKVIPDNLRQVHLITLDILQERDLIPGEIGENITIQGLDLLNMSAGTKLSFMSSEQGSVPSVTLTGLRNPCWQIDKHRTGLKETFLVRDAERNIIERRAGVMAVVEKSGSITKGAIVVVEQPADFVPLAPV